MPYNSLLVALDKNISTVALAAFGGSLPLGFGVLILFS